MADKISFADERERELLASFNLGEDVQRFLRSDPVGQYLHHRAKIEIGQAEVDALKIDPDGGGLLAWLSVRRKLRRLRQRADAARMVIAWLGEAILEGQAAERELMGEQ